MRVADAPRSMPRQLSQAGLQLSPFRQIFYRSAQREISLCQPSPAARWPLFLARSSKRMTLLAASGTAPLYGSAALERHDARNGGDAESIMKNAFITIFVRRRFCFNAPPSTWATIPFPHNTSPQVREMMAHGRTTIFLYHYFYAGLLSAMMIAAAVANSSRLHNSRHHFVEGYAKFTTAFFRVYNATAAYAPAYHHYSA